MVMIVDTRTSVTVVIVSVNAANSDGFSGVAIGRSTRRL
jgi:hypothetical protein